MKTSSALLPGRGTKLQACALICARASPGVMTCSSACSTKITEQTKVIMLVAGMALEHDCLH